MPTTSQISQQAKKAASAAVASAKAAKKKAAQNSAAAVPVRPLLVQPAFASQLQNTPPAMGVNVAVQRGYMIWADKKMARAFGYTGGVFGDGRDVIAFALNPSTISSDYTIGNTSIQAAMMQQVPGDNGNFLAPLQQTVSWQLYYDRTFELCWPTGTNQVNDPGTIGCQADVLQFAQFTGLLSSTQGLSSSDVSALVNTTAGTTSTGASVSSQQIGSVLANGGMMMMVPCYVFFGDAWSQVANGKGVSSYSALSYQLAYYGYISEWSVEYTHWTQNMIPIRCSITVNFTMLPQPQQSTQAAVWQDMEKLRGQPASADPGAPGYKPSPPPNQAI